MPHRDAAREQRIGGRRAGGVRQARLGERSGELNREGVRTLVPSTPDPASVRPTPKQPIGGWTKIIAPPCTARDMPLLCC